MSWYAGIVDEGKKKKKEGKKSGSHDGRHGEFELLVAKEGPRVVLEREVGKAGRGVGGRGEDGEEVVEKTFFQK